MNIPSISINLAVAYTQGGVGTSQHLCISCIWQTFDTLQTKETSESRAGAACWGADIVLVLVVPALETEYVIWSAGAMCQSSPKLASGPHC